MGFHSVLCVGCEHPLLSHQATTKGVNEWMNDAVAIHAGRPVVGSYDGYGSIGGFEHATDSATCWHEACWRLAQCPLSSDTISASAPDQGWFFEDGAHDLPDPRRLLHGIHVATVVCSNDAMEQAGVEVYAFMVLDHEKRPYGVFMSLSEAAAHAEALILR